jgi:phosphatidylglycerol:prolipoprotein diacylglycerol transferase
LISPSITFPILGEGFVIDPPRFITIFGFDIYYYGLFFTAAFALAAVYLYLRREALGLTQDNVLDLVIMAVPCGIVGARLYYIIFNISNYIYAAAGWLSMAA